MVRLEQSSTSLESALAEVAKGETVEILRHGLPVARVIPPPQASDPEKVRQAVAELRELRKGVTLGGLKIKELIDEGRRY